MSSLFAKKRKRAVPSGSDEAASDGAAAATSQSSSSSTSSSSSSSSSNTSSRIVTAPKSSSSSSITSTFLSLGISAPLVKTLTALSIKIPSAIQRASIPAILRGSHIIAIGSTGSGKTAAFALPILERLSPDPYGIFAVVLSPTRELASQINDQFVLFGSSVSLSTLLVVGGADMVSQACALGRRPHVVVATPGRLMDHLRGPTPPPLSALRFLVLDEADRLLSVNSGFRADVAGIVTAANKGKGGGQGCCQTLLFSATMAHDLDDVVARVGGGGRGGGGKFEKIVVEDGKGDDTLLFCLE